jgi:hypothetical protein
MDIPIIPSMQLHQLVSAIEEKVRNHIEECEKCHEIYGEPYVISYGKKGKKIEYYDPVNRTYVTKQEFTKLDIRIVYLCWECIKEFRKIYFYFPSILTIILFIGSSLFIPIIIGLYWFQVFNQITMNGICVSVFVFIFLSIIAIALSIVNLKNKVSMGRNLAMYLCKEKLLKQGYDELLIFPLGRITVGNEVCIHQNWKE